MKRFIVTTLLLGLAFYCIGCEESLTEKQWVERYKPETIEQAEAMATLNTAKVKAESEAETLRIMNKFKIACAIGFVGAIIALGVGLWLRMKLLVGIGVIGVAGCLAGYSLACADIVYSKHVAVVGLVFGVAVGGATLYIIIRALMEIIKGNEMFKKDAPANVIDTFKKAHSLKDGGTQHSLTEKIVSIEQSKLEKKEKNNE